MATRINYTQETLGNLTDVLTNDAFVLQFARIPNGYGTPQDLRLRCKSVSLPDMSNEAIAVDLHSFQMNFRGRKRNGSGDVNVTFVEFKDAKVSTALRGWHEYVVGTQSGNSAGYKKDYSTTCVLTVFDTVGAPALEFTIYNMFITMFPELQLDSSAQAAMEHSCTFKCDYYEQTGGNKVTSM